MDEQNNPTDQNKPLENLKAAEEKALAKLKSFKYKKILKIAGAVIFFIFAAHFLKGCFFKPKKEGPPPKSVQVQEVIQKDVPVYLTAFGTLDSCMDAQIISQVSGRIKSVHFHTGSEVEKDQLLYIIDPSEYKANFEKAKATLAEDMADLKIKKDTLDRNRVLFEKGLISKQEFEQYQTDAEVAEAKVQLDEANVELERIILDYCYIRAPWNGKTSDHQLDPGNIVTADSGPELTGLKALDVLHLFFALPEKDFPKVKKTMDEKRLEVQFTVQGDDNAYEGAMDLIDNTIDDTTGTVTLRASVKNDERKLWPGQFARVKLILGQIDNAVLAPYEAVQIGQKGHYLFVVTDDNKADFRNVTVGQKQDDYIVIEKGVKVGEKVVTVGQLGLSPDVLVKIVQPQDAQKGQDSKQTAKK